MKGIEYVVTVGEVRRIVSITDGNGVFIDNRELSGVEFTSVTTGACALRLNGTVYNVVLVRSSENNGGQKELELAVNGVVLRVRIDDKRSLLLQSIGRSVQGDVGSFTVRAPMPGLVAKVEVSQGDNVKAGDGIAILEAMKMENEIRCPLAGIVSEVRVQPGQSVERNDVLAIVTGS